MKFNNTILAAAIAGLIIGGAHKASADQHEKKDEAKAEKNGCGGKDACGGKNGCGGKKHKHGKGKHKGKHKGEHKAEAPPAEAAPETK